MHQIEALCGPENFKKSNLAGSSKDGLHLPLQFLIFCTME